jgi:hypothetical protein
VHPKKALALAAGLVAAALALSTGLTPSIGAAGSSSRSTTPVFGDGAELHLRPLWAARYGQHVSNAAHLGTRVEAVGLGFHPGATVRLIYAVPNANFVMQPVSQAVVNPAGRFDTTLTVTRTMDRGGPYAPSGRYGGPDQPLLFEADERSSPGVGPRHAYAVSTLLVYSP